MLLQGSWVSESFLGHATSPPCRHLVVGQAIVFESPINFLKPQILAAFLLRKPPVSADWLASVFAAFGSVRSVDVDYECVLSSARVIREARARDVRGGRDCRDGRVPRPTSPRSIWAGLFKHFC